MYLVDVPAGGRTIFPLCTAPSVAVSSAHASLAKSLKREWRGHEGRFERSIDTEILRGKPAEALLREACRGKHGTSVTPRRGAAVMFDSVLRNGRPNHLTWHGGCDVLKGTKLTAQKFKATPIEGRP